jgi:hypothetical protein
MPLGVALLKPSLELRHRQAAVENAAGDSLEAILERLLRTVEAAAGDDLRASILLLSPDGRRLLHGAAPSLPEAYCDAIHGSEIGPAAGSCGTAAYLGHPVHVTDIETDPLWADYKHLALAHGLRACWSTPIEDARGRLLGTFAIYHLTPRSPTPGELEAVRLITWHAAEAIATCRPARYAAGAGERRLLSAANNNGLAPTGTLSPAARRLWRGMQQIERCRYRAEMAQSASARGSAALRAEMEAAAQEWRELAREYELQLQDEPGEE